MVCRILLSVDANIRNDMELYQIYNGKNSKKQ